MAPAHRQCQTPFQWPNAYFWPWGTRGTWSAWARGVWLPSSCCCYESYHGQAWKTPVTCKWNLWFFSKGSQKSVFLPLFQNLSHKTAHPYSSTRPFKAQQLNDHIPIALWCSFIVTQHFYCVLASSKTPQLCFPVPHTRLWNPALTVTQPRAWQINTKSQD